MLINFFEELGSFISVFEEELDIGDFCSPFSTLAFFFRVPGAGNPCLNPSKCIDEGKVVNYLHINIGYPKELSLFFFKRL